MIKIVVTINAKHHLQIVFGHCPVTTILTGCSNIFYDDIIPVAFPIIGIVVALKILTYCYEKAYHH